MPFLHLGQNVYNLEKLFWFDIVQTHEVKVFACFAHASSTVYIDAKSLEDAKTILESKLNGFICIPQENQYRYLNPQKSYYYDFEKMALVFPNMEPLTIDYEPVWNLKTCNLWPNKAINRTQVEDFKIWILDNKLSIYVYFTVGKGYEPHKLKSVLIDTMEDAQYFLYHLALE
jgi:hypothetical protein